MSSNRSFGALFTIVFLIAGLWPLWGGGPVRQWALAVAAAFAIAAAVAPAGLTPLNRAWYRLGLAMHRVVNPVVMAVLFYLVVTPFALITRVLRKGLRQRLAPDREATTYWVDKAGQPASRMEQQF